jgi:hypothetical protein
MHKKRLLIATLLPALLISSGAAQQLTLTTDLGVQGIYRHCEYSNGKVYGVDANRTCPASMQEPAATGKGMGYLKTENQEGTSKLCVYRVSGQDRSTRVDTHANCPLNQAFN